MTKNVKARIQQEARKDAVLFHEEFPGQAIDGDWDATAWSMAPASLQKAKGGWELYKKTLTLNIEALVDDALVQS